ncbi:hypothetical protein TrRE_jg10686, partial [Triparma retinervis]
LKVSVTGAAKEFKSVLMERTEGMKQKDDRRQRFGKVGGLADVGRQGGLRKNVTLAPQPGAQPGGGEGWGRDEKQKQLGVHKRASPRKDNLPRPGDRNANKGARGGGETTIIGGGRLPANPLASKYAAELSALDQYTSGSGEQTLTPFEIAQMEERGGSEMSQLLIPTANNYLSSRADAVSQIEGHIAELGTVFQRLASMVSEHGELVQRVEDNVEDAHDNIQGGITQLTRTLEGLRSNKMLVMKVMAVLTVFIVFFVTVLA